jgi:Raf kinase inhibitor-like YbhB/YbcL family protein
MTLRLQSDAFDDAGEIPEAHAYKGGGRSPALRWHGLPQQTKALALIMEDPDAPRGTFVHWLAYNIPVTEAGLEEGLEHRGDKTEGTLQGRNDFGEVGYGGPKPPKGERHRYVFKLFALDSKLKLEPGADKQALERAMRGHTLAQTELVGLFGS